MEIQAVQGLKWTKKFDYEGRMFLIPFNEKVCRETLDIMMAVRGYHFAPTHAIQDNSPVENVIAMYQAAHKYGKY